jgi:MoxR-like ATPase
MQKKTLDACFNPSLQAFDLPEADGWPESRHQFDEQSIWAIRAALVTGRPLLVRGEPGTGKSQLARAAAMTMGRPLLYEVINSHIEVTDLLFQFDAVARLAEAQILGASGKNVEEIRKTISPDKFVRPGKIWWAVNWPSALIQAQVSGSFVPAAKEDNWKKGCVLLVDEIDKADSELPNALLECFANQSFQVPYFKDPVGRCVDQPAPLVVVTTNEERELPAPFLRRCLVLHLNLYDDDKKLKEFLVGRGKVHFEPQYKNSGSYEIVLDKAADLLISDRKNADKGGLHRPGQAEYLDLCRAVFEIANQDKSVSPEKILSQVAGFALKKNQELG